ncbi:hypothetical protein O5204_21210 [Escherichia coli]|nr:hypothetical protein [Escherichia coli]MCZ4980852.1 hypothetical protein [Escherichia coli]MCZ4988031.1 hypothetical protein [Escherichia coli]MCZ5112373.1 hypothetical protein [Escherichia coli]MCZ5159534.1 hypothetical protein [Escherichia coli]
MILTLNDKREISQIIASFTDEDYERINSEVDRLCKRCDPISEMLRSYKPDEHTKDAIDWLEDDDCNYQEKAAEWFWDAITERVKAEYAFWICPYISRHLLSLNPLLACCRRYSRGER